MNLHLHVSYVLVCLVSPYGPYDGCHPSVIFGIHVYAVSLHQPSQQIQHPEARQSPGVGVDARRL